MASWCRFISDKIRQIKPLFICVSTQSSVVLQLDCCNSPLTGLPAQASNLQHIIRMQQRVWHSISWDTLTVLMLVSLHSSLWALASSSALLIFKDIIVTAPTFIPSLRAYIPSPPLWSASQCQLEVPPTPHSKVSRHSIHWNSHLVNSIQAALIIRGIV